MPGWALVATIDSPCSASLRDKAFANIEHASLDWA
jgi:hypothetical protein